MACDLLDGEGGEGGSISVRCGEMQGKWKFSNIPEGARLAQAYGLNVSPLAQAEIGMVDLLRFGPRVSFCYRLTG